MDAINANPAFALEYIKNLNALVYSEQSPTLLDFNLLTSLENQTINGYYVIKQVVELEASGWLIIADTLTFLGGYYGKVYLNDDVARQKALDPNVLYTSHIYLTQDPKSRITFCYSVQPENESHKSHNLDFSKFLISYAKKENYTFKIAAPPYHF